MFGNLIVLGFKMIDKNVDPVKKEEMTLTPLEKDELMNSTVKAKTNTLNCFKRILFLKF